MISLGIDRRRAGLAFGSFVVAGKLGSADSVVSFREDGRRHNLVGNWKVFQEEATLVDAVGR